MGGAGNVEAEECGLLLSGNLFILPKSEVGCLLREDEGTGNRGVDIFLEVMKRSLLKLNVARQASWETSEGRKCIFLLLVVHRVVKSCPTMLRSLEIGVAAAVIFLGV